MEFERHRETWEKLGRQDPMWAILSEASKKGGHWDADEFFRRGGAAVRWVADHLAKVGCEPARGHALDFGCGLGRLTQPLCDHFEQVTGIDVARSMIEGAQRHNRHPGKCRYLVNATADLRQFEDATFDFVLSLIVLQHMRPEFAKGYLAEFLRVLRPGGVLFFQVPEVPKDRIARDYKNSASIEMYGMSRGEVRACLEQHGGEVVDVAANDWAGPGWFSAHYTVRKPA